MPPGSIRGSNPCTGATTITATIGAGTAIVAGGDDRRRRAGRRGAPGLAVSSHGDRVAAAALERGNEIRARIGEAETARLERMTQQKESGQRETIGDVLRRRIARLAEKGRQRQQLVLPRLALPPRHGASRFRRHIDEIVGAATYGPSCEVETEAEVP